LTDLWVRTIGDIIGITATFAGMHFTHFKSNRFKWWAIVCFAYLLLATGDLDALLGPPDSFLALSVWRPTIPKYILAVALWYLALKQRKRVCDNLAEIPPPR
jgi:hypothetical protein